MKDKRYMLNTTLAVVLGLCLAVCLLLKVWIPAIVLPVLNIPHMAAVSLAALVLDHYLGKGAKRCYPCAAVFAALTFGVLPYAAGFMPLSEIWKPALVGSVVFTALTFLYTSIQDRLSTGPVAKAAPVLSALGLFLACQCFAGIIL
jgi:hypothetical protein